MTKKVDKKSIQEALKAELDKDIINEGPLGGMSGNSYWDRDSRKMFDRYGKLNQITDLMGQGASAVGQGVKKATKNSALDGISGMASGIGNMFSNLGGQYRLGKINNQLKRTSDRIKVDWEKAEDVATKLANKLGNSKNPQVQRAGAQAAANLQSASQDIQKATGKLDQLANAGVDKPGSVSGPDGDDFNWQSKVDEFGNKYSESPVERWIRSWGGDMNQLSKADHGRITKQFMNLRAAGLNPFNIPQDKVQPILAAHEFRVNQINATGKDPYPNGEHLEKILGRGGSQAQEKQPEELEDSEVEDVEQEEDTTVKAQAKIDASKKSGTTPKLSRKDIEALLAKDNQKSSPAIAAPSQNQSTNQKPPIPPGQGKINKYIGDLVKFATNKGVKSDMMGKYVATHLSQVAHNGMFNPKEIEYIKQFAKQYGVSVKPSVAGFGGGNFDADQYSNSIEHQPKANNAQGEPRFGGPAMPPPNQARMQPGPNQSANQPTNQKSINAPVQTKAQDQSLNKMNPQAAVQASPIKQVGSEPTPIKLPKQQIGEPTEVSNLTNFFGDLPEPADESQLPVPPTEEEQRTDELRAAATSGNAKKALDFMKKYPTPPRKKDDMSLLPKDVNKKKSSTKKVSARKKSSK